MAESQYQFFAPKLIGRYSIICNDGVRTFDSGSRKFLNFPAYERRGMTMYKADGLPYPSSELFESLHKLDELNEGMKLLVPYPFSGGYNRSTVKEVPGDAAYSEGDKLPMSLNYDLGYPDVGIEAE